MYILYIHHSTHQRSEFIIEDQTFFIYLKLDRGPELEGELAECVLALSKDDDLEIAMRIPRLLTFPEKRYVKLFTTAKCKRNLQIFFEFNLFLACCKLYYMKAKFVCSTCGKEIPKGLTPLKCGDNFLDDYHCLDVFVAD